MVEMWRERVFPLLLDPLSTAPSACSMRAYFTLHHEATLINLLECFMYHDYAAEALGDGLIDFLDYCARRVNNLIASTHARNSIRRPTAQGSGGAGGAGAGQEDEEEDDSDAFGDPGVPASAAAAAAKLAKESANPAAAARKQLRLWLRQESFRIGVTCVTCLRYVADYAAKLPLSVMTRLLDTHDVALMMVPLIENPPWVRKISRVVPAAAPASTSAGGASSSSSSPPPTKTITVWQKYVGLQWVDVEPANLLKLTAPEGQPWLALHALLLEPDARRRYILTSHRISTLGRVRKYLNEVLLDQLPILPELQRFLDEASITGGRGGESDDKGKLLLDTVPAVQTMVEHKARLAPAGWEPKSGAAARVAAVPASGAASSTAPSILQIASSSSGADDDEAGRLAWDWNEAAEYIASTAFAPRARKGKGKSSGGGGASATKRKAPSSAYMETWPDSDNDADLMHFGSAFAAGSAADDLSLGEPKCALCGKPATKRCSRCHNEWYCSRDCQVAAWKGHKIVCDVVVANPPR